jgi:hypothetical protein
MPEGTSFRYPTKGSDEWYARKEEVRELFVDILHFENLEDWQIEAIISPEFAGAGRTAFLCGPRQIGKTTLAVAYVILHFISGRRVLYLTHKGETAQDVMQRALVVSQALEEAGLITRIQNSQGYYNIYGPNGASIQFRSRGSAKAAVGKSLDVILWDEAQTAKPGFEHQVQPTLITSKFRYQLWVGTPPDEECYDNGAAENPYCRAREQHDPNYTEYSAAEEYDPTLAVTKEALSKANPAVTRIDQLWEQVDHLRREMDHLALCREYLGVWNPPKDMTKLDPILTPKQVASILTRKGSINSRFVYSVGFHIDSPTAYISTGDGLISEVAARLDISDGNLEEIADYLQERMTAISRLVISGNARGQALFKLLQERRLKVLIDHTNLLTLPELSNNVARFLTQARDEQSLQVHSSDLTDVELALSTFWCPQNEKTRGLDINSTQPEHIAMLYSLVNSTKSGTVENRMTSNQILKVSTLGGRSRAPF